MVTNYLTPENSVSITRGTTKTIRVTVTNPDGTLTNITGSKLVLTVKEDFYNDLPLIQKLTTDATQGQITKPREGEVEFYFFPSDTHGLAVKNYIFDVWLLTATGERYAVVPPTTLFVSDSVTYLPV